MVGKTIQNYRKKKRLSLSELACRAGVAKSYLSSIERNIQKNPSIEFLNKIANVLGVRIEALIHDDMETATVPYEMEWLQLARDARDAGISIDEVRSYIEQYK